MKRSRYVALAALGVVGASFLFSGKEDTKEKPSDAALYATLDECIRANVLGTGICEDEFRNAQERHVSEAPKYNENANCEKEYGPGQCRKVQFNGASVFVPAMVGFMVGNYLSSARRAQALLPPRLSAQPCPPGISPQVQPGCVMPRPATTSSSSSSRASSSWLDFSTSNGNSVSRARTGNGTTKVHSTTASPASTHSATSSRSSGSSSHSATVSRGGFGSSAHSVSSRSGS